MKKLLLMLSLVMALPVMADTVDVQSYWFDGSQAVGNVMLSTEKTRTEWRSVRVPATCYRTEMRRRCTRQPQQCRQVCRNGQCRRVCSQPRTICRNVQVRVPYRCYRMERRPFEVHDYYVDTHAELNFDLTNVSGGAGENFSVRMNGERDGISVKGSKNYLAMLVNKNRTERRNGDVKQVNLNYDVTFASAKKITETLGNGIKNVSLRGGVLKFELGSSFNTTEFIQNLKVFRSRRMATDILLFDRNLTEQDMDIQTNGSRAVVTVDLASLGINVPAKTRVIMNTKYNTRGLLILNPNDVKTEASANWIFSK